MPRIARIIAVDYPHHIIQRGNNKQVVFQDDEDKFSYLDILKKYSEESKCVIKTYCLMNNHIHILMIPKQKDSIAKSMQKISLVYTQYFNKKYNRTGRLWECRFHSCVVDNDSYFLSVHRYIERNPVRAKIVDNPADYEWSGAKINTSSGCCENGFIEPIWKKDIDRNDYTKFLNNPDDENDIEEIEKCAFSGKPFGPRGFSKKIIN